MAQMHVSVASNTPGTGATIASNNVLAGQQVHQQVHTLDEHAAAAFINSQLLLSSAAPGLEFLYETCRQVYPQQENPLQVTAFIKYWSVCHLAFQRKRKVTQSLVS